MAKTGEVYEKDDSVIEWKIKNFFGLATNVKNQYFSPSFSFANASWCLSIYPNGSKQHNSEGYIDLYLNRETLGPPISLEFSLGLKTVTGKIDPWRNFTCIIEKTDDSENYKGYGTAQVLSRWELLERKCQLSPQNNITVVCTLKYSTNFKASDQKAAAKCSYCKISLAANEDASSHLQKCKEFPIKCPKCDGLIALKNWCNHNCQKPITEVDEKLLNDFKSMMLNGDHSDTTIKVKGEEFKLHRNILASRNLYFHSMFNCSMKETNTGNVIIDDCEPDVFRSFVHFLYTGKLDKLNLENVCDLYEVSDKYQEDQLKRDCLHFMTDTLSVDNFCDFTVLAFRYDEKELLQKAVKFFAKRMKEILFTVKWQSLLAKYPTQANELLIKAIM